MRERRLVWLAVCMAAGLGVGLIGFHLSEREWWFAAVPVALAIGWFVFADPGACLPPGKKHGNASQ